MASRPTAFRSWETVSYAERVEALQSFRKDLLFVLRLLPAKTFVQVELCSSLSSGHFSP